ncbi:MAG TPA: TonB-dependent receptor [Vicinamibacterales bacterium]|nr:TonB-dependent receptor [Vicinamibacterales bacterium]
MITRHRCRSPLKLLVVAILAVFVPRADAQDTVSYASVSGRVTDPSGAVIVGAQVTARQTETNLTASAVSDAEGRFRLTYLRLGPYEIVVHADGFAPFVQQLRLSVGSALELPVTLAIGPMQETVAVTASAVVLEAARSQIAGTVNQEEIKTLPLNGRNFQDIALLVPGVAPPNLGSASTQLFSETSAVAGSGLSISSQRNLSNNFIVDGLSANDDAAALAGTSVGVDALDQFQVVTSGGQAELGRALGGYVNIVTRSGSNTPHGSAYGFFRDDSLNADNPLLIQTVPDGDLKKLPMNQQQFGASAGGPIVKDRAFYFTNVEERTLDQAGLVTILQDNVAAINAQLEKAGYQGPKVTTGTYPNPVDTTTLIAKVDHRFSDADLFTVRYNLYRADSRNARGAGQLNAPSASAGLDSIDHGIAFGNVATLSSRTIHETRGQFVYSDLKALSSDLVGPQVSIAGVATFGTLSSSPQTRLNKMFQVVDNLTHQAGEHSFKTGVDFLYNNATIAFPRSFRGSYSFADMPSFLGGGYNSSNGFTQTFGNPVVAQGNSNVGMYIQDEWKIRPNMTINAGLRYDLQFLKTIETDTDNLSPRLGVAWVPFDGRQTVIRGSAGVFYDRVPLRALANALLSAGNTTDLNAINQYSVGLGPTQTGAPVFPQILNAPVPLVTLFNFTTMDPHLQNAQSRQASVEVEQQLGSRYSLSAGYQYLAGRHLLMSINQNVPTCATSGNNNGCRPNQSYANNSQYSGAGSSTYHGVHVTFAQRPTSWGSYRVSYTLSKSMNDVGEFFFSGPLDPADLSKDWARSDDDQRHRLVVTGSLQSSTAPATSAWERISHGFVLSANLQAYSEAPYNVTTGTQTIQGTSARPMMDGEYIDRNAGVGSAFFTLGLRLSRSFNVGPASIEGIVEGFNVTNRVNVLARNSVFGTGTYPTNPLPTFGQVTAIGEPRAFQFGIRVRY